MSTRRKFEELHKLFPQELDLVMVEEMAEQIAERFPKPREVVTKTLDKKDVSFTGTYNIISVTVRGKLRELTLHSKSKKFHVYILADKMVKLDRSFEELDAISEYLNVIDAFEVDGEYVVHLKDLSWERKFLLTVTARTGEEVTFSNIFAIWDEARE